MELHIEAFRELSEVGGRPSELDVLFDELTNGLFEFANPAHQLLVSGHDTTHHAEKALTLAAANEPDCAKVHSVRRAALM